MKQDAEGIITDERGGDDLSPSDPEGSETDGRSVVAGEGSAKLPATTFTKVEKSLASLGFFTPSSRRIKDQRIKRISFTREVDGKRIEVTAEILPTILGLPVTADQDKYLALQKMITDLLQSEGAITNPIRFTSADLLRLLNKRVRTGKNYKDIGEWLKVMTATAIASNGVVYIAGKKRFVNDTFHVFDRTVSVGKELDDGTIADANYVWLSAWQLENINNNFLLPIDLESYRELKNHIAKALVPLLQIWLFASHKAGSFEKRYDELCEILNLQKYNAPSLILRQFKPSLDELTTHGYIEKWRIEKTSNRKAYKVILFHGPKFHRDRRRRLEQKRRATEPPVLIAESVPIDPILPEPGRIEDEKPEPAVPGGTAAHGADGVISSNQEQFVASSHSEPAAAPDTKDSLETHEPSVRPEMELPSSEEAHEEQAAAPQAAVDPIDPKLIDDLAARGIMPSVAMKLLGALAPERLARVSDYVEYWESISGAKGPGLLYNLIRDGDPLPAGFETARQRADRRAAEERKARLLRAQRALEEAYEGYTRDTIDHFIQEEYPKDELARRIEAKAQEFNSQPTFWDKLQKPEMTEQMARHAVWAEIAKQVSVLSFDDFCRREAARILAAHGLTPADMGMVAADPTTELG